MTPKEKVAITTLVSLPYTTHTISLNKLRNKNVLHTMSISSQGGVEHTKEDIDLNEVITIPKFDLDNISLE